MPAFLDALRALAPDLLAAAADIAAASAASISPGSIRKPRSFTCASARPKNSSTPSLRQRAKYTAPVS